MNQNRFRIIVFAFFPFLVSACIGNLYKPTESLPAHHQWNHTELRQLQGLSLYNYQPSPDLGNSAIGNSAAIALGHKLFFNTGLSKNGTIACASCHLPEKYFTDGRSQAHGLHSTTRNTPTIVGASNNTWFFHDGRVDSLWAQALHPIENSLEHGSSRSQLARLIYSDAALKSLYEKAFGPMPDISDAKRFPLHAAPIEDDAAFTAWENMREQDREVILDIFVNAGKAIAAYETELQTDYSRFDHYVQAISSQQYGRASSLLSADEVSGLRIFLNEGKCFICHNGPHFTDQGFHNIGTPPLNPKRYDYGRSKAISKLKRSDFNCTSKYNENRNKRCDELKYLRIHQEENMGAFKTPGLRNVSKTAPYMHAGQYASLAQVLKHYNKPPNTKLGMNSLKVLDIKLNDKQLEQLEAFLHTLDSSIKAPPQLLSP